MYVTKALIKGFRSLEDVSLDFYPGINVLVGKNNAGKSNIIRALDMVLGEKWPTYREIGDRDFYRKSSGTDPVDHFLIAVCLEGAVNTEIIEDNVGAYVYSLSENPIWNTYSDLINELDAPGEYKKGQGLRDFLSNTKEIWLYLIVPRNNRRGERVFGANILHQDDNWYRIQSLKAPIRDALLTTAFVPAFRDPSNQLRITSFTWYGRLIRRLYEQRTEEQDQRIEKAREDLDQVLDDIFQHTTAALRNRLSRAIAHHHVWFKAGAFTRDDDYKQITLFVNDGIDAPFYDKGSGIQSALIIALFAHYCDEFHQGGSLLLIEEPELYLHPQGRRALEAQLVEFAQPREKGGERQVIISTHSPEFLRSAPLYQVTLVSKSPKSTASHTCQIEPNDLDEEELRKVQKELATKNAEMVFADHVLLVEGGEEHLLPALADLYFGESHWFDTHNVSVLPVKGKGNFGIYTKILNKFGIRWTILADLDFLREGLQKIDVEHSLSEEARQALITIRTEWNEVVSTQPSGRRIKEKVFDPNTRDWCRLYAEVDAAITELTSGKPLRRERLDHICRLWESLKDRVSHKNYEAVIHAFGDEIRLVIGELREHGIFVLSHGELEDYFTEEALNLGGSKETRAMNVAREIGTTCETWEDVGRWLKQFDEFASLIDHIRGQLGLESENQSAEVDRYETEEMGSVEWTTETPPFEMEDG